MRRVERTWTFLLESLHHTTVSWFLNHHWLSQTELPASLQECWTYSASEKYSQLHLLHILLHYSLIPKINEIHFSPQNCAHNAPQSQGEKPKIWHGCTCKYSQPLFSTLLKHLWQQLQSQVFFSMKLQASTPIFEKFLPFFLQNRSSSNRLECRFTFKSLHSLSIGLKSGLWLGHSPKATPLLCRLCLGLLSCWKMNLLPPWGPDHSGYHQEWLCILIHSSFPRLVSQFLLHSVMQPPPCFTVAMVLARWWEVSGFPQTWHLASRPEWEFLTINL